MQIREPRPGKGENDAIIIEQLPTHPLQAQCHQNNCVVVFTSDDLSGGLVRKITIRETATAKPSFTHAGLVLPHGPPNQQSTADVFGIPGSRALTFSAFYYQEPFSHQANPLLMNLADGQYDFFIDQVQDGEVIHFRWPNRTIP